MGRKKANKARRPRPPHQGPPGPPRPRDAADDADGGHVLTVSSDVDPVTGTYVASVSAGEDYTRVLSRDDALAYARTILEAAQRAEYDAAVVRQLVQLGTPQDAAISTLRDMWQDRLDLDSTATAPMTVVPGMSSSKLVGGLRIFLGDDPANCPPDRQGSWTIAEAREHALQVLETVFAVDFDSAYLRFLRGTVGLDEATARATVADLGRFREEAAAVG